VWSLATAGAVINGLLAGERVVDGAFCFLEAFEFVAETCGVLEVEVGGGTAHAFVDTGVACDVIALIDAGQDITEVLLDRCSSIHGYALHTVFN